MPEQNEKLKLFTEAVLNEVNRENEQLSQELKSARTAAVDAARAEAHEKSEAYFNVEAARIRTDAGREISRHLMDAKRQVYLRRKEIGEAVFDRVREKLVQFTRSEEYPAYLKKLLASSLAQLGGATAVVLRLNEADLQYADLLTASAAPVSVRCERGNFVLGGLTVHCPELGLQVDASFDTRLAELSDSFVEQFGLSLSDDLDDISGGAEA